MWETRRWRARGAGIDSARAVPLAFRRHAAAVAIVLAATVALAAVVLPSAGWGFTDDDVFILHFLRERAYPPPVWGESGRFFPLGHQEWRLLYFWTSDIAIYHAFSFLQYAGFGLGVYALQREVRVPSRLALGFALTLPPVLVAFANLVLQERTQLLVLPWLLFALLRWDRTQNYWYAALAIVSAQFMLYAKEPGVLFILPIALLRLVTPVGQAMTALSRGNGDALRHSARSAVADIGLLFSCLAFLAIYFSVVSFDTLFSRHVYDGRSLGVDGLSSAIAAWAGKEPLLVALLAVGLVRLSARAWRRRLPDFSDQVIVGALAYFASLVSSGLVSTYYGAVPMAAAAIALGPVATTTKDHAREPGLLYSAVFGVGIALNLFFATPHLAYRQDWISRNEDLTEELQRLLPQEESGRRVFLRGHSWDAEMLAVYANGYRALGIAFFIDDRGYAENREEEARTCDASPGACLVYAPRPPDGVLVADLGVLEHSRSAYLFKDEELLWRYEDERLGRLFSLTPGFLHGALRHAYDFW